VTEKQRAMAKTQFYCQYRKELDAWEFISLAYSYAIYTKT